MRKVSGVTLVAGLAASLLVLLPTAQGAPVAQGQVVGTVFVNPAVIGEPCVINLSSPPYRFEGVFINGLFRDDASANWAGSIQVDDTKGKAIQCFDTVAEPGHKSSQGEPWNSSVIFGGDMGTVNCPVSWYNAATNLCPTGSSSTLSNAANNSFSPAHFNACMGIAVDNVCNGQRLVGLFFGTYLRDGPHTKVILQVFSKILPIDAADPGWQYCANYGFVTGIGYTTVGPNPANCPGGAVYVAAEFAPLVENTGLGYTSAEFTGTWGSTRPW